MLWSGRREIVLTASLLLSLGLPVPQAVAEHPHQGRTELVSVAPDGRAAGSSQFEEIPVLSADGRYVAFASEDALVPGDTNGVTDVYVRDRVAGTTERVSVSSDEAEGNSFSSSHMPFYSISADGRYVAFVSGASNLVPGDTNDAPDIFVRDRVAGTTERVSVSSDGTETERPDPSLPRRAGNHGDSLYPAISADGRYVVFESFAPNLVSGDTNGERDWFVHDRETKVTERVSVASDGSQQEGTSSRFGGGSIQASISADGRFVAFVSSASNLVPGDTDDSFDVFVHDRKTKVTDRVSMASETEADWAIRPSISADGRYVAFDSWRPNLVPGDTNQSGDVFVHDRETGTTERVSISSNGSQAYGGIGEFVGGGRTLTSSAGRASSWGASISADGRYVAFESFAWNLAADNRVGDIFVHDRATQTTQLVTVPFDPALNCWFSMACAAQGGLASISADGRHVAFVSSGRNIVADDPDGEPQRGCDVPCIRDVFVRDIGPSTFWAAEVSIDQPADGSPVSSSSASMGLAGGVVGFEEPTPQERTYYRWRLSFSNGGTCDSQAFGLTIHKFGVGDRVSSGSCAFLENTTPLNEVLHQVDEVAGTNNMAVRTVYDADDGPPLAGTPLTLDASRPATGVVATESSSTAGMNIWAGLTSIDIELIGVERLTQDRVTLGATTVSYTATPEQKTYETPWSIDLPDRWDKKDFVGLAMEHTVRGYNVRHGFVKDNATTVTVPTYSASFDRRVEVAVDDGPFTTTGVTLSDDLNRWNATLPTPASGTHIIKVRALQGFKAFWPMTRTITVGGPTPVPTPTPTPTGSPSPSPSESPPGELSQLTFTGNSATSGQYSDKTRFEAKLTDSNGDPIRDAELVFELTGAESSRPFNATTDQDGIASMTPILEEKPGPYQLTVRYDGDDDHEPSADTTSFVVDKEDTELELTEEKGKDKALVASLYDADTPAAGIAGRTIDFYRGTELLGSATTDEDGVATFEPPKQKGKKEPYEARFDGDDFYLASSAQAGKGGKGGKGGGG